MKCPETNPVEAMEDIVGWGAPIEHKKVDEKVNRYNESDFCDSPTNASSDGSISTDEGIWGHTDDEEVEKVKDGRNPGGIEEAFMTVP